MKVCLCLAISSFGTNLCRLESGMMSQWAMSLGPFCVPVLHFVTQIAVCAILQIGQARWKLEEKGS